MLDLGDSRTFWLNLTNITLGFATLLPLLLIVAAVIGEVAHRRETGGHARAVPIEYFKSHPNWQIPK
jgi:hypothetical protein